MGCDLSSQTVRPHTCGGTSPPVGVTLDHDSRWKNGSAYDVSNLLNRPDKVNATEVHEGLLTTNLSIQSDSTSCVDKLICEVARITYPQNVIAAIKRGDTEIVKSLCRATAGHTASGINSLGTNSHKQYCMQLRTMVTASACMQLISSDLQYQELGIRQH